MDSLVFRNDRSRRSSKVDKEDGERREIELLKMCKSVYERQRNDKLPQNLEVSIGKWYIVVRGRLWQAFREKLSSGHACIYPLILFDPTIRRMHAYTSAFASFTYSKNTRVHARISFELISVRSIVLHEHFDFLRI